MAGLKSATLVEVRNLCDKLTIRGLLMIQIRWESLKSSQSSSKDSYEKVFAYNVVRDNVKENFHIQSFLLAFLAVKLFKFAMVDSVRSIIGSF